MAKRRRTNTINELLGSLFSLGSIVVFFMVFNAMKSFTAAGVAFGLMVGAAFLLAALIRVIDREKLRKSGILDIDRMGGRQFEFYLGELFKSQGFRVEVTQASTDYGADLIITKEGRRIVVQAKRHKGKVGVSAVREVGMSLPYYKAQEAWVVTNSYFTSQAHSLAAPGQVRLIDRDELISMILKMNPGAAPKPKQIMAQVPKELKCPKCGPPTSRQKWPFLRLFILS